jgi:hypothetical protein
MASSSKRQREAYELKSICADNEQDDKSTNIPPAKSPNFGSVGPDGTNLGPRGTAATLATTGKMSRFGFSGGVSRLQPPKHITTMHTPGMFKTQVVVPSNNQDENDKSANIINANVETAHENKQTTKKSLQLNIIVKEASNNETTKSASVKKSWSSHSRPSNSSNPKPGSSVTKPVSVAKRTTLQPPRTILKPQASNHSALTVPSSSAHKADNVQVNAKNAPSIDKRDEVLRIDDIESGVVVTPTDPKLSSCSALLHDHFSSIIASIDEVAKPRRSKARAHDTKMKLEESKAVAAECRTLLRRIADEVPQLNTHTHTIQQRTNSPMYPIALPENRFDIVPNLLGCYDITQCWRL